jgi:hypothetical protein
MLGMTPPPTEFTNCTVHDAYSRFCQYLDRYYFERLFIASVDIIRETSKSIVVYLHSVSN